MHCIDPNSLPRIDGVVARFLLNPHGEIGGLLLADGLEVHVPPHLDAELRAAMRPGAAIGVFGVRPRGVGMTAAAAIEAEPGRLISDNGPPKTEHGAGGPGKAAGHKPEARAPQPPMQAAGDMRCAIVGRGGTISIIPKEQA